VIRVCFHGAESTGETTLSRSLAEELGCPWVPELGRAYCEARGTDLTMADLLAIAAQQDAAMRAACALLPPLVVLDTDPLMTAAWAEMLFGEVPPMLLAYDKAERYLLFAPDVPWIADGTRFFGAEDARARVSAVAEAMLLRAAVPFTRIGGSWRARERRAREAIAALLA
jgi:NadR type nicotinamide-nucleotide adenylyltransferase